MENDRQDKAEDLCNENQNMAIMIIGKSETITPTL